MNQDYSDVAKKIQEPFNAMAKLNMEWFQSFAQFKTEDLSKLKNHEEMIEAQMKMALSHGYKAMEYMQKSFQIIEKTLLSMAKETKSKH